MTLKNIIFIVVLIGALGIFAFSLRRMIAFISIGKPDNRMDRLWERFKKMVTVAMFRRINGT
jgi:hypothetical protein